MREARSLEIHTSALCDSRTVAAQTCKFLSLQSHMTRGIAFHLKKAAIFIKNARNMNQKSLFFLGIL